MRGLLPVHGQSLFERPKEGQVDEDSQLRLDARRTATCFGYQLKIGTPGDDMLRHLEKL